jgi:DNA-binding XRE family transcriptional regulator
LNKKIKQIRSELKLTQKQIAKELNTSQSTISQIESNKLFGETYKEYLTLLVKKGADINLLFSEKK